MRLRCCHGLFMSLVAAGLLLSLPACKREVAISCPSCAGWTFRGQSDLYLLATAPQRDPLTTDSVSLLFVEVSATEAWRSGGYVYLNVYDHQNDFVCQVGNDAGEPGLSWAEAVGTREFY